MNTQELTDLAVTLAQHHEELARGEASKEARAAHLSTMKSLDKCAMEFAKGAIPVKAGNVWLVTSRTNGGNVYRVNPATGTCTCEAGMANKLCWHKVCVEVCEQLGETQAPQPQPATPAHYETEPPEFAPPDYVLAESPVGAGGFAETSFDDFTFDTF